VDGGCSDSDHLSFRLFGDGDGGLLGFRVGLGGGEVRLFSFSFSGSSFDLPSSLKTIGYVPRNCKQQ
jgi:hypothetical protein